LKQTAELEEVRKKDIESRMAKMAPSISIRDSCGNSRVLSTVEVTEMLQRQQQTIIELINRLKGADSEIERLQTTIKGLNNRQCNIETVSNNNNIVVTPDIVYY
jgi:archaellum component FlaC